MFIFVRISFHQNKAEGCAPKGRHRGARLWGENAFDLALLTSKWFASVKVRSFKGQ